MTLDALATKFSGDEVVRKNDVPSGFTGYLADELRNISFPGEQGSANAALRSFAAFVAADAEARRGGDLEAATVAFDRLDADLKHVTAINDSEFQKAVERGAQDLAGFDLINPLATLGIFVLAAFGLRPRSQENTY